MTNDNDARGALTDEQIVAIAAKSGIGPNSAIEFARAIQAASLPAGNGLTDADRQIIRSALHEYQYRALDAAKKKGITEESRARVLGWAKRSEELKAILAAPRQPGEMGAGARPTELPTNDVLEELYESTHFGHVADFAADVLQRWGGWMPGLLGYGGSLNAASAQQEMGAGVQTCPRCGKPTAMLFEFDGTRHCGCLHTQSAASAQQDEREASEPPLGGRWHHGNGVVVCGTLRVFTEDFDTDPAQEFKEQLLTWVCDTLNAAQARAAQHVQADAGAVAWRTGEIVWAVEEDAKRHAHWNKLTVESLYTRPSAESDKRDATVADRVWAFIEYVAKPLHKNGAILREQAQALLDNRAAMSREQSGWGE